MKLPVRSRIWLSGRGGRLTLWLGGASLALMSFVQITRELLEGEVASVDRAVQLAATNARTPWLTVAAVDVTALGSVTLVVLLSLFALMVLLVLRDWRDAMQLVAASAGSGILTSITKNFIERMRPAEAQQLVTVSGFSYPSGHSVSTAALYLTIAIIAVRHVRRPGARAAIVLAAVLVVLLVGASRVYLGVHYATDVVSGVSLGVAWALLLAALFGPPDHGRIDHHHFDRHPSS
ncbi:MAG: phosphatase PAP2 family protein [Bryobacteraceae bacterium]